MSATDDAKRRKIKQLRALAASTTFPAEAVSARAKADKLEGELVPEPTIKGFTAEQLNQAYRNCANYGAQQQNVYGSALQDELRRCYEQQLDEILRGHR